MSAEEISNLKIKNIDDKFSLMFEQNKLDHESISEKVDKGFEAQNKKMEEIIDMINKIAESKANKWVEKFLVWAGSIIGLGMLTYLGTLVLKATIFFNQ